MLGEQGHNNVFIAWVQIYTLSHQDATDSKSYHLMFLEEKILPVLNRKPSVIKHVPVSEI